MTVRTVAEEDPTQQLAAADRAWGELRRSTSAPAETVRDAAAALVVAARLTGRYREALHVGREAAEVLEGKDPAALGFVEAHVCLAILDAGDADEAAKWLARATSRPASRRTDEDARGTLLRAEGNLHLATGRFKEARAAFEEHARIAKDDVERSIARCNVGEACIRLGLLDEARPIFDEVVAVKEKHGDRWGLAYARWGRGVCLLATSSAGAAEASAGNGALEDAEQGIMLAQTLADPKILARLRTLHGRALMQLDRLAQGEAAIRDALREAVRAGPRERADAQLALAQLHVEKSQGRRAIQAAEQALEIANKAGLADLAAEASAVATDARGMLTNDDTGPLHRRK